MKQNWYDGGWFTDYARMDPLITSYRFKSPRAQRVNQQICNNEQSQAKRLRGLETLIAYVLD